jgi:hypothetical protein
MANSFEAVVTGSGFRRRVVASRLAEVGMRVR